MESTYNYGDAVVIRKMFNSYATNDFVYISYPVNDSTIPETFFIQRLIGLPGDSILLTEKKLYINRVKIEDPASLRFNFFISIKNRMADSLFKMKYSFAEGGPVSDKHDYGFSLTQSEFEVVKNDSLVKKAGIKKEKQNTADETCFPSSVHYLWNMDFYGPLYIPKKGDTLRLDSVNLNLYSTLIRDYEENKLEQKHDSIFINDELRNYYITKQNYYFVLGDNRDNANDSRVWGFLPKEYLKGKVLYKIRGK